MASSMSAKYSIQALDTIPAVETPCTLTNPHSQSLDWVGNTSNRININNVGTTLKMSEYYIHL